MKKLVYSLMLVALLVFAGCEKEWWLLPDVTDTTDTTYVPDVTDTIDIPDVPDTIDTPDVPDTIDTPDVPDTVPSGDGLFSVSAGHQVRFAPGNLDYNGGYFFTAHQYDYGGLFGWGTGSNPTLTSWDCHDYPTFDDWGNHISGGWRTLSWEEWHYVIWDRADAYAKRGAATVCGVHGMVLLPDNWSGGTFNAGFAGFDFVNRWSWNVYDASSWSDMETAGAVFLPAAGFRYGAELGGVGTCGHYWPSTPDDVFGAYYMYFSEYDVFGCCDSDGRYYGRSVRLVQDY